MTLRLADFDIERCKSGFGRHWVAREYDLAAGGWYGNSEIVQNAGSVRRKVAKRRVCELKTGKMGVIKANSGPICDVEPGLQARPGHDRSKTRFR